MWEELGLLLLHLKMKEEGHEPRNEDSLEKLEKGRNGLSL